MKKILIIVCAIAIISAVGCGNPSDGTVSQEKYEELMAAFEKLSAESEQATIDAKITGAFVATVRVIMPDYTLDDTTPRMVILQEFQGNPFLLWVGEEIATQLMAGQTYYFAVEDTPIGEIPLTEFHQGYYYPDKHTYPLYNIKSVRAPEDGETGLSAPSLRYERNK